MLYSLFIAFTKTRNILPYWLSQASPFTNCLWMGRCVPNVYMHSNMKKTTQTTLWKATFQRSKSPNVWLHWAHYSWTKTLCRPWRRAKSIQKPLTKKGVTVITQEDHHPSEGLDLHTVSTVWTPTPALLSIVFGLLSPKSIYWGLTIW